MKLSVIKRAVCHPAILVVLDGLYLYYTFFCPVHDQDGLTIFFFTIFSCVINITIGLALLFLKYRRWGMAFLLNAVLFPFAFYLSAFASGRLAWQKEHIDYQFHVNDSLFDLDILRNDTLFGICYRGSDYSEEYCSGTYIKTGKDEYLLTVDTTRDLPVKDWQHISFRIANDSIYGFRGQSAGLR